MNLHRHPPGASANAIAAAEATLRRRLAACTVPDEHRHLTLELVVLYSRSGQHGLAMQHLRRLLQGTADTAEQVDYLLGLGQLMEQVGDFAGASVFYGEGLDLGRGPADARYLLHSHLGHCLNQSGRHREAEGHCRAAIAIDPDRHDAHENLAVALEGQGRPAAAAELFIRAVHLCPANARALRRLDQLMAAHGSVVAEIPDIAAKLDECRELVDAFRRRGTEQARTKLSG